MRPDEVKKLVQRYIVSVSKSGKTLGTVAINPLLTVCQRTMTEADGKPSQEQWQDHLSKFSVDNIKDHAEALKRNDLLGIERTAQEFIQRYSLSVERGSAVYRLLCRVVPKSTTHIN